MSSFELIEVAPPGSKVKLRYGNPWRGYNDSQEPSIVGRDELVDGSLNFYLDNLARKLIRRKGLANLQDNILESAITYNTYALRGIDIKEYRADSLGPNFSFSLATLWADEVASATAYGVLAWFDPTAGSFKTIMQTADADFPNNVKPFAFIGGNRMGASAAGATVPADRVRHAAGSRNMLEVNDAIYFPCFGTDGTPPRGTPHKWMKGYPASGAGTANQIERAMPTGLMPPLWMPRIGFTNVGGLTSQANWLGKDLFYISCFFIRDDGAWGPICEPRPPSTILANGADCSADCSPSDQGGFGLIKLSAVATDGARQITWSGIPQPPAGYSHIGLVRSPKVDGSTTGLLPDPSDMRLVAIIPKGQTTYTDSSGNDNALNVDTRIRTEPQSLDKHIWPPRARHMFPFDGRVAVSYVRDNPCAILVSAKGNAATNDEFNTDDVNVTALASTARCYVAIVTAAAGSHTAPNNGFVYLDLIYRDTVGAPNNVQRESYRLADYTMETLVDRINSGTFSANDLGSGSARRWHAQLVPGCNRAAPATDLVSHGFSSGQGTNFDDDATWTSGVGSGPGSAAGVNYNPQRCFGPGWPGVLMTSLPNRPIFRDFLYFTRGGPAEPVNSAENWSLRNNRRAPSGAGYMMGGAPLLDGALIACSNKICILRNKKDGKTGSDEDYRIEIIDEMRGALGPPIQGPGFAVVLTDQGLMAYDEEGNVLPLSEKLYNPADRTGQLAYEIGECIKARSRDLRASSGDVGVTDYFNMAIGNGKLWISYRSSASVYIADRYMQMDFSPGLEQRGLASLIDPMTKEVWGWSTPLDPPNSGGGNYQYAGPSAMTLMRGDIAGTTASKWYACFDDHVGAAVEGRVVEFDVDTVDFGATVIPGTALLKVDKVGGSRYRFRALQAVVDWRSPDRASTLEYSRSGGAFGTAISLGVSGTTRDAEHIPFTISQRGPGISGQLRFKDPQAAAADDPAELWGIELDVEIIDTGVI